MAVQHHTLLGFQDVLLSLRLGRHTTQGTTFLHRALAYHPQIQFLPYFEALESVAPPSLEPENIGDPVHDSRVARTDEAMQAIHLLRPLFDKLMVMGAQVPFEEMQLSAHCFSSQLWEASVGFTPRYSQWYRQQDQEFGYASFVLDVVLHRVLCEVWRWSHAASVSRKCRMQVVWSNMS